MPQSKKSAKRRKKTKARVKHVNSSNPPTPSEYMKTDGQCRVCVYSVNHKFLRFATDEEIEKEINQ